MKESELITISVMRVREYVQARDLTHPDNMTVMSLLNHQCAPFGNILVLFCDVLDYLCLTMTRLPTILFPCTSQPPLFSFLLPSCYAPITWNPETSPQTVSREDGIETF
jgi:hypothetical protein